MRLLVLLLTITWMPMLAVGNDLICPFKAGDLFRVTKFQEFPCSCCAKFCGNQRALATSDKQKHVCDNDKVICEISFGECRLRALPAQSAPGWTTAVYGLLYFLLVILWIVTFLVLIKMALQDERRIVSKELMLGRRIQKTDRDAEAWAVGLGFLFLIVSIVPFLMAVRLGRRKARKEQRQKEIERRATKTVGTFLGNFFFGGESRLGANMRSVSPVPSSPSSSPPQRIPLPSRQAPLDDSSSNHSPFRQVELDSNRPHYSLEQNFGTNRKDFTEDEDFWVPKEDHESVLQASKRVFSRFFEVVTNRLHRKTTSTSSDGSLNRIGGEEIRAVSVRVLEANDEGDSSPQRLVVKSTVRPSPIKKMRSYFSSIQCVENDVIVSSPVRAPGTRSFVTENGRLPSSPVKSLRAYIANIGSKETREHTTNAGSVIRGNNSTVVVVSDTTKFEMT